MGKSWAVLATVGLFCAPAAAQTPPAGQVQPAKPLTVKKRVCEYAEEDSYSRLGGRKICRTIEVKVEDPAKQPQSQQPQQQPVQPSQPNTGR